MRDKPSNIFLVGLMGAGKTTLGRALAKRLDWRFVDSDHEIESRTGVNIPTIFEIEGESGFRKRECHVIAELSQEEHLVMATGGGAILSGENRYILQKRGLVVYLDVAPTALFERTRNDKNRPLLQVPDPLEKLRELHKMRDPLYRQIADLVISGQNHNALQLIIREFTKSCEA